MESQKEELKDVPETMLWTLHNRAVEAMRDDGIIKDKKAIEIYKSIDYDYQKNFGKAEPSHAVRSLDFDREIRKFLKKYPNGTIINLGEGLETQRFRFEENNALWISIDVLEAIEIRERFIQPDEKHIHLAISATNKSWLNVVSKDKPVFITAQGLFMYFTENDVRLLIQEITKTFKNGYLMFDTIPMWLSKKTISKKGWAKTKNYTTPKMPWGINRNKIKETLKSWIEKETKVFDLGYSDFPRGITRWAFSLISSTPILKNITPSIVKIDF